MGIDDTGEDRETGKVVNADSHLFSSFSMA